MRLSSNLKKIVFYGVTIALIIFGVVWLKTIMPDKYAFIIATFIWGTLIASIAGFFHEKIINGK